MCGEMTCISVDTCYIPHTYRERGEWEKVERPEKQEGKRTERGKESLGLRLPWDLKEKVSQYLNQSLPGSADGMNVLEVACTSYIPLQTMTD